MERQIYREFVRILEEELVPAMGCTEPIAVAYAAALARSVLGRCPEEILVRASANIIKNVKSVVVPNTGGLRGIAAAAAAGVAAGREEKKLEVLSEVTPEQIGEVKKLIDTLDCVVEQADNDRVFYIEVTVKGGGIRLGWRLRTITPTSQRSSGMAKCSARVLTRRGSPGVLRTGACSPWNGSWSLLTVPELRTSKWYFSARSTATPPLPRRACGAATVPGSEAFCSVPMGTKSITEPRPTQRQALMGG